MATQEIPKVASDPGVLPVRHRHTWLGVTLLAMLATTLMLQAMRVFVSYMVFVIDQSNRTALAAIALGVFLAIGLAGPLASRVGVRTTVTLAVALLGLSRLIIQFWEAPVPRLWLGAAAIVAWGCVIIPLLARRREPAALGFVLAFALDLLIRIAFQTVDLAWANTLATMSVAVLLVLGLGAALLAAGSAWESTDELSPSAASLVAAGPAIALFHLMTGNLGLVQERLDIAFPEAAVLLAFGTMLGTLLASLRLAGDISLLAGRRGRLAWLAGSALIASTGLWATWHVPVLAPLGMIIGVAATLVLLTETLLGSRSVRTGHRLTATTAWFTAGMVLQVVLLFAYYTFTGAPALIAVSLALFILGTGLSLRGWAARPSARSVSAIAPAATLSGLLLLASIWHLVRWNEPVADHVINNEMTVMTYNIQTGFSVDNYFSLEMTARTIEAANPDVVVLQEISRGWLVASGIDQVLWLSRRLEMDYVFGASSGDGLWGNAILSRAPLGASRHYQFRSTQNLKRSVVEVPVQTAEGEVVILGTHLDNPTGAGLVRLEQTEQLIAFWSNRSPAILMGDLNATPDDVVLTTLGSAGFRDLGSDLRLDPSAFTSEDGRRIDYILATPEIRAMGLFIPDIWTSDHRPVVARVMLPR